MVILCFLLISGCVDYAQVRSSAPIASVTSRKPMTAAASCMVAALNHSFDRRFSHRIDTIEPGRVVEVVPQQTVNLYGETYFVRVTQTDRGSRIDSFGPAMPGWSALRTAPNNCA